MMRLSLSHVFHTATPILLTVIAQKAHNRCVAIRNVLARFFSCNQDDDMSKIGINGFGRIGRLVLRASLERGGQVWMEDSSTKLAESHMFS